MAQKKKVLKMVVLVIIGVVLLGVAIYIGIIVHWANTTEVEMIGKTHLDFYVEPDQIVTAQDFIQPSGKAQVLTQITEDVRLQIAAYMRENNLKLCEGHHYFPKRSIINGNEVIVSLNEYLSDFKFEPIQSPNPCQGDGSVDNID